MGVLCRSAIAISALIFAASCNSVNDDVGSAEEMVPMPGRPSKGAVIVDGTIEGVDYFVRDGMAVIEGDISLGPVEEFRTASQKLLPNIGRSVLGVDLDNEVKAVGEKGKNWTNGVIPFQLSPELSVLYQRRIDTAMSHITQSTGGVIKFVKRTSANASQYPNYVQVIRISGSVSDAVPGMSPGRNYLRLGDGATTGLIIHELGHEIGLWHEHKRADRDTAVRIIVGNIVDGHQSQFAKSGSKENLLGPYDLSSIMHYLPRTFSKNGLPTIVPIKGKITRGNRLSVLDVAGIRRKYGAR